MELLENHLLLVDIRVLIVLIVLYQVDINKVVIGSRVFLLPLLPLDLERVLIIQIVLEKLHNLKGLSLPLKHRVMLKFDQLKRFGV